MNVQKRTNIRVDVITVVKVTFGQRSVQILLELLYTGLFNHFSKSVDLGILFGLKKTCPNPREVYTTSENVAITSALAYV